MKLRRNNIVNIRAILALMIFFSTQAYSQIHIKEIKEKIVTYFNVEKNRNRSEGSWLEAVDSRSGFNLLGRFDFSKGFDFYKEQCAQESFIELRCKSATKNWFAFVEYEQDLNSRIIYIDRIKFYACESRKWEDVSKDLISKNGAPKRASGWGMTYEENEYELYITQGSPDYRLVVEETACKVNNNFLMMEIKRTMNGDKVLREAIDAWRHEKSRNNLPIF